MPSARREAKWPSPSAVKPKPARIIGRTRHGAKTCVSAAPSAKTYWRESRSTSTPAERRKTTAGAIATCALAHRGEDRVDARRSAAEVRRGRLLGAPGDGDHVEARACAEVERRATSCERARSRGARARRRCSCASRARRVPVSNGTAKRSERASDGRRTPCETADGAGADRADPGPEPSAMGPTPASVASSSPKADGRRGRAAAPPSPVARREDDDRGGDRRRRRGAAQGGAGCAAGSRLGEERGLDGGLHGGGDLLANDGRRRVARDRATKADLARPAVGDEEDGVGRRGEIDLDAPATTRGGLASTSATTTREVQPREQLADRVLERGVVVPADDVKDDAAG